MAGTGLTHDNLIQAFERRFDYLSARAVAAQVLDSAGVAKADQYDAGALARIGKAIEANVAQPERILTVLPHANGAAAKVEAPAAEAKAHAAEAKAHATEAKAHAVEAKAEAAEAKAEAAEAKAEGDAADQGHGDKKHGGGDKKPDAGGEQAKKK
jgi:hypothetical protein